MKEKEFQKVVINFLNKNNILFRKNSTGLFFKKIGEKYLPFKVGVNGESDLEIYLPNGKILFIELKTDKTYQNLNQIEFEKNINALGFEYLILKPKNWQEFQTKLELWNYV